MKKGLLLVLLLGINFNLAALASSFIVCKSTFALCTTARCTPVSGKKGLVSCGCSVQTGYSMGKKPCQDVKQTRLGQLIKSRYYPIKTYMVCSNNHPWAWCLDKPCIIDKNNPSQASCMCSLVKNKGSFIIVTDRYNKSLCTNGIISSATVTQANQGTNFLKTQPNLKPFPIKVYKSDTAG